MLRVETKSGRPSHTRGIGKRWIPHPPALPAVPRLLIPTCNHTFIDLIPFWKVPLSPAPNSEL